MHYLGSKNRHSKEIIAITCANRKKGSWYVEPFVGGGNVINKVPESGGPRLGNDLNSEMVALLEALGDGWVPPLTMSHDEWKTLMKSHGATFTSDGEVAHEGSKGRRLHGTQVNIKDRNASALFALAAVGVTFGSLWCGQWIKDDGTRWRQAREGALRDAAGLRNITWDSVSYDELKIPEESIVYCDPPYSKTTGYEGSSVIIPVGTSLDQNNWKAGNFWKWADKLVDSGHRVFVSEYAGPPSYIYDGKTPEIKDEQIKLLAEGKKLDADPKSPREAREALRAQIADVDRRIRAGRDRQAERWVSLWEKEVVSDFSATREAGAKDGKVEIEKLFHRKP